MAIRWRAKTAEEVVVREIPWAGRLNGDTIATSELKVVCGGLSAEVTAQGDDIIFVKVSGGNPCERVVLLNTITTDSGLTLVESIEMDVRPATGLTAPAGPSTSKKRVLIDMAFEAAGLSGYTFDQTPEERASALRALDAMMAAWDAKGVCLGYNFPESFGEGDEDDASGIPDWAINAVRLSLAKQIVAGIGKTLSRETEANLTSAMSDLHARTLHIPRQELPHGTPRGAGNRAFSIRRPYHWPSRYGRGC